MRGGEISRARFFTVLLSTTIRSGGIQRAEGQQIEVGWSYFTCKGFLRFVVLWTRGAGRHCRLSPGGGWYEVDGC